MKYLTFIYYCQKQNSYFFVPHKLRIFKHLQKYLKMFLPQQECRAQIPYLSDKDQWKEKLQLYNDRQILVQKLIKQNQVNRRLIFLQNIDQIQSQVHINEKIILKRRFHENIHNFTHNLYSYIFLNLCIRTYCAFRSSPKYTPCQTFIAILTQSYKCQILGSPNTTNYKHYKKCIEQQQINLFRDKRNRTYLVLKLCSWQSQQQCGIDWNRNALRKIKRRRLIQVRKVKSCVSNCQIIEYWIVKLIDFKRIYFKISSSKKIFQKFGCEAIELYCLKNYETFFDFLDEPQYILIMNKIYIKYVRLIILQQLQHFMSLKNFQFLEKLGQGAYSSVYKVKRQIDNQIYALKKVKIRNLSDKQKILASINHPNIVSYRQAFLDQNSQSLCIVMEFLDDGDVLQLINKHKQLGHYIQQEKIWKIASQTIKGLNQLHKLKILHRDMKSANVFLNKDDTAKLGDMNVSKIAKKGLSYTQTGTPYYASPEVWKQKPYDKKSDIWSMGCVIYEMTTLKPPFRAQDMQGLYRKVIRGKFSHIPSNFSNNLYQLIKMMLQAFLWQNKIIEKLLQMDMIQCHLPIVDQSKIQSLLLKTIRIPRNLYYLTQKLPRSNYRNSKLLNSMVQQNGENVVNFPSIKQKLNRNLKYSLKNKQEEEILMESRQSKNSRGSISRRKYQYHIEQIYGRLKPKQQLLIYGQGVNKHSALALPRLKKQYVQII